jgi:hypothetical protein
MWHGEIAGVSWVSGVRGLNSVRARVSCPEAGFSVPEFSGLRSYRPAGLHTAYYLHNPGRLNSATETLDSVILSMVGEGGKYLAFLTVFYEDT